MENRETIIIFSAFYEPYLSGAERFVKEVVERLGPRYRFVLFTARLSGSLPRREERPWGEIRRLGFGLTADKWFYPILAPLFALYTDARIAHAVMESYAGIALWIYGMLRPRSRRILTLQSGDLDAKVGTRDSGLGTRVPVWLWSRIHTGPTAITAISRYLADRAVRLGAKPDHVGVIPNGVDLAEAAAIRGEMIPRVAHRIVCVARLSPEKGIETLIRALAEVRKKITDAHLVIVGDGLLRTDLPTLAESLGVKDAVAFLGALAHREALREIAQGEAFACPSLAEGLGIVFIEAQAVGTPAVGTQVGGIPDVIEDGRTGLLVPPSDPVALASAIVRLFEDKDLAARLSSAALGEIKRFDWNRIAQSVAEVYETFLSFPPFDSTQGKPQQGPARHRLPASNCVAVSGLAGGSRTVCLDSRFHGNDKKTKIVIATGIYPPEIGGPATYAATLSAGLSSRGFPVEIVSYGDPAVSRAVPKGVNLRLVSRVGGRVLRYLRYFTAVFRAARDARLVYILDPVSAGFPATAAAVLRRKPTVLKVVGDYAWEQGTARGKISVLLDQFQKTKAPASVELLRIIQRGVARRARRVVVPSRYLEVIVRQWGVRTDHVAVITNAVHLPGTSAAQVPVADRPPVVISAGRFLPWKGMETLIRCFPEVRQRVPNARLVLVGDGPSRPSMERAIREVGGGTWVELPGRLRQSDLHERIRNAAVFALVSGYEGFSHQIIEAMALGTPIIASNAGGNPEVIRDGGNGVLVPYNNAERTAAAIVGLLEDRSRSATLAAAAREDARQYTEERMVEETIRLFRDLCG